MSENDTRNQLESILLEHQQLRRRLRWLTLVVAALLAVEGGRWLALLREGRSPGELRATRLVLVDEQGRVRAELGLAPGAQEPHLSLHHPNGSMWAALTRVAPPGAPAERRQAILLLQDETGKARVSLGASQYESGLMLYEPQGAPGLALYTSADAQGLFISDGTAPRIHLRYNRHDDAALSEFLLLDEQKRQQVTLRAGRGGASHELYRPDGEHTFRAP